MTHSAMTQPLGPWDGMAPSRSFASRVQPYFVRNGEAPWPALPATSAPPARRQRPAPQHLVVPRPDSAWSSSTPLVAAWFSVGALKRW